MSVIQRVSIPPPRINLNDNSPLSSQTKIEFSKSSHRKYIFDFLDKSQFTIVVLVLITGMQSCLATEDTNYSDGLTVGFRPYNTPLSVNIENPQDSFNIGGSGIWVQGYGEKATLNISAHQMSVETTSKVAQAPWGTDYYGIASRYASDINIKADSLIIEDLIPENQKNDMSYGIYLDHMAEHNSVIVDLNNVGDLIIKNFDVAIAQGTSSEAKQENLINIKKAKNVKLLFDSERDRGVNNTAIAVHTSTNKGKTSAYTIDAKENIEISGYRDGISATGSSAVSLKSDDSINLVGIGEGTALKASAWNEAGEDTNGIKLESGIIQISGFDLGINTTAGMNGSMPRVDLIAKKSVLIEARDEVISTKSKLASVNISAPNIILLSGTEANPGTAIDATFRSQTNIVASNKLIVRGSIYSVFDRGIGNFVKPSDLKGSPTMVYLSGGSGSAILAPTIESGWGDIKLDLSSVVGGEKTFLKSNLTTYSEGVLPPRVSNKSDGNIFLNLKGGETLFEGTSSTDLTKERTIQINMDEGSTWNVVASSQVTKFTVNNSSVNLAYSPDPLTASNWKKIKGNELSGRDSNFFMHMNLAEENAETIATDQLEFSEGNGSQWIKLTLSADETVADKLHSINWLAHVDSGELTMKLDNDYAAANGGVAQYVLRFVADENLETVDWTAVANDKSQVSSTNVPGGWYLIKKEPDDIDPPTPEVDENTSVGISATQALAFASEMEDLRTRLGEVRYGSQAGGWVRLTAEKDSAGSFEQKTNAVHVGFDRLVHVSESNAWLLGAAFRYGDSDQEGYAEERVDGTLKQYSAKLYASWMNDAGYYADFIIQAGRYEQDLDGVANDRKTSWKADYNTWGWGASVELGHMFNWSQDEQADDRLWYSHWFIEPQAQLSYFQSQGADYRTSTGLNVEQDDANFLTGRLGFVLGKKWNYGTLDDLDVRYVQLAVKAGLKYEFLGDQTIHFRGADGVTRSCEATDFGGLAHYYGVLLDWQMTDSLRGYADFHREESDELTRDYVFNLGLKYRY